MRVAPGEWCGLETQTPPLSPLPLAKGRGETNAMERTTGGQDRLEKLASPSGVHDKFTIEALANQLQRLGATL